MREIQITFADGTVRTWRHEGRAGGSWTKTIEFNNGWVTVRDEQGDTYSFQAFAVREVQTKE